VSDELIISGNICVLEDGVVGKTWLMHINITPNAAVTDKVEGILFRFLQHHFSF